MITTLLHKLFDTGVRFVRRIFSALDRWFASRSAKCLFWTSFVGHLIVAVLLVVAAIGVADSKTRFTATVETQVLTVKIPVGQATPKFLQGANLFAVKGLPCPVPKFIPSEGGVGLSLAFTIQGTDPVVQVSNLPGRAKTIGTAFCPDGDKELDLATAELDLRVSDKKQDVRRLIVLDGVGQLGAEPNDVTDVTLLSGKISYSTSSTTRESARLSGSEDLVLGDVIRFANAGGEDAPLGRYVIRLDGQADRFQVSAHATANEVEVLRGADVQAYTVGVSPSLWARVQAWPLWAMVPIVIALLLNLFSNVRHYADARRSGGGD